MLKRTLFYTSKTTKTRNFRKFVEINNKGGYE